MGAIPRTRQFRGASQNPKIKSKNFGGLLKNKKIRFLQN